MKQKMKSSIKLLAITSLVYLLSACSDNYSKEDFDEVCIDNVTYLIKDGSRSNRGYLTVKLNTESKVVICNSTPEP